MEFIEEIFKRAMETLSGFDLYVAVIAVVLAVVGWFLIGAKNRTERKKLTRQLTLAAIVLLSAGAVILTHHLIPLRQFSPDVSGILVLRIEGDDNTDSLQRELISRLDVELAKDTTGRKIEIWAADDFVGKTQGLRDAHNKARQIGEKRKALLVIWGTKSKGGETRFFPCITIVRTNKNLNLEGERTLMLQDIAEVSLPAESIKEPIYLAHFIEGYRFYERKQYREALDHFEAVEHYSQATPNETADLRLFSGLCHWHIAQGQKHMLEHLQLAIDDFTLAGRYFEETGNLEKFAQAQNNLGGAYWSLPTGNRADNINKAIAVYKSVLDVCNERDFPFGWASAQNNLGVAYRSLPTGDRSKNIKESLTAFQAALRVMAEKDFLVDWALTQVNVGAAYFDLPTGDRAENLTNAIVSYRSALGIITEQEFPVEWAITQNNLGNAYSQLMTGNRAENLVNAIAVYQAALRVRTEKDYPFYWAETQDNLGSAYKDLPTGDHAQNLTNAIAAKQAALRVLTETNFPADWAMTQYNLGNVYAELPTGDRAENLTNSIAAYNAALRVYNETNFPLNWAQTWNQLGRAYWYLPTGEHTENLKKSKACLLNSLKIWKPDTSPDDYQRAAKNLQLVEAELQSLNQN